MKQFDIPELYRSSFIGTIKRVRKDDDPKKKDHSPTTLDFGSIRFHIARHFGFCYGVENAIEISYRALDENPNKRIFLLSQMIHNPSVNADLEDRGIRFIMDTEGNQLIAWDEITENDIVITPAFGTTLEIEGTLKEKGIEPQQYNTTCPFVERVWKRSAKLGEDNHTVIIHGKPSHEETRATFSHSQSEAPSLVIKDMDEAAELGKFITGDREAAEFESAFDGRYSEGFDPATDLQRIGVVNQTTMLASETQAIAEYLKQCIIDAHGEVNYKDHFADTRDTLCYATNDNQQATFGLLKQPADLAIVVGGYNSSNTSHLVELCEEKLPTYFISSAGEIESKEVIRHFNYHNQEMVETNGYLPAKEPLDVILTSGASCPDTLVDEVLDKLLGYFTPERSKEEVLEGLTDGVRQDS